MTCFIYTQGIFGSRAFQIQLANETASDASLQLSSLTCEKLENFLQQLIRNGKLRVANPSQAHTVLDTNEGYFIPECKKSTGIYIIS